MIEGFLPADYALCGVTIVMAVLGLFRGLSGTLGFVSAVLAAAFAASFGWAYSAALTAVAWAHSGVWLDYSTLAQKVSAYVR